MATRRPYNVVQNITGKTDTTANNTLETEVQENAPPKPPPPPEVFGVPPPPPPKSPEQTLTDLQVQQIQEEQDWNELIRPYLLQQMGLTEENYYIDPATGKRVDEQGYELDEYGQRVEEEIEVAPGVFEFVDRRLTDSPESKKNVRQMTEDERVALMTPEEKSAYETEKILAERQGRAARGELETPGYVEDEISRQRETQENLLSQRLGAKGSRLSTAGINTRADMLGREAGVRSAYAYGQEQTGMGLLGSYNQYLNNQIGRNVNLYGGFTNAGMNLIPMAQTAAQPYSFGRQLQNEQSLLEQQRKTALQGGLMSGIGTAASMYLTKGMGGSS